MGCRTVRVSDPLWGADSPSVVAGAIVCIHLLFCSQGSVHLSREGVCLPSLMLTARFAPSVVTLTAFNSFPIAVIKYLTNNNNNNKTLRGWRVFSGSWFRGTAHRVREDRSSSSMWWQVPKAAHLHLDRLGNGTGNRVSL